MATVYLPGQRPPGYTVTYMSSEHGPLTFADGKAEVSDEQAQWLIQHQVIAAPEVKPTEQRKDSSPVEVGVNNVNTNQNPLPGTPGDEPVGV